MTKLLPAPQHGDHRRQIEAEQTRLLYAQASTNLVVTALNSIVVVAVLRSVVAPSALLGWLAVMLVVTTGRGLLVWRFRRTAPPAEDHRLWRRRFIVGAFCAGLAWGAAAVVLFPAGSQAHQIFVAFVLGGMITGGVAVLSWAPGAFVAFVLPTALPLIAQFSLQGGEMFIAMAGLSVVFVAAVITTSRQLQASVAESLALRFEKTALIQDLSLSERRTATANVALRAEIVERTRAEEELRAARAQLEVRVEERTADLLSSVTALREEVGARAGAERALQRERDLLEVTLASIGDAVIATDARATLTFMNPVAEQLTGWSARDAVGHRVGDVFRILDEQSRQAIESPVERVLRERVVVGLANQTILAARDGREVPIADSGSPIRGKDGQVHGAVMVFRDVTERRATEAALRKAKEAAETADRAKSEFLATMSHELRTPLNVIIGYSSLLNEEAFGTMNDEQRDIVTRVDASAHQLFELVAAMLDLSRIEAGRLPVHAQKIEVPELLAEVKDETRELQERSGLQFAWGVERGVPPIRTDPGKLKVIVKNLVANAIKFTKKGRVEVTASPARDGVEIRVRDTGIGISREALPVIFDPFRQIEGDPTDQQEGTGLGLHIVKRLVELLGGRVGVESEEGRGSTFRVWVPLRVDAG